MTLVVSGLGVTPVSTRQRAARWAGAGIQVESVAWAAAAWEVKTSSASAGGETAAHVRRAAMVASRARTRRWGAEVVMNGSGLGADVAGAPAA